MRPRRVSAWLIVLVGLLASCSSSSDAPTANAASTPAAEPVGEIVSAQFCDRATAFVTDSRVRFITAPDAAVFADIDVTLAALINDSPAGIADDVTALRTGFAAIGEAYAAAGYEPSADLVVPVDVQESNLQASRNLERVLLASCDLDEVRTEQIAQIGNAFGIDDPAMSECLHAQMGNIANIEASTLTPELMTAEVCGTSIFGLLSGATAGE